MAYMEIIYASSDHSTSFIGIAELLCFQER